MTKSDSVLVSFLAVLVTIANVIWTLNDDRLSTEWLWFDIPMFLAAVVWFVLEMMTDE